MQTSSSNFDLSNFPAAERTRSRSAIEKGKGNMPAWITIPSDEEIIALIAYVTRE